MLIRGEAVRSCVRPVSQVQNVEITTLEGLAKDGQLHPIQQAWIDEQVPACGFCQNGQILTAKALLDKTPNPTDAQIRDGMKGALCRCMTYYRINAAVKLRGAEDGGDERMTPAATSSRPQACSCVGSPRSPLDERRARSAGRGQAAGPYPDLDFLQLDSWIVIRPDNTATFFVGKTDLGQGTGTAFRQIMSDELDIAFENTTCVMGSTDITVDQGGSGGSDALQTDGYPMRRVAAEARRVLLDMASEHFGVPVTALVVSDGVITSRRTGDTADRSITYGELIGGKKFNVTLTGRNIDATTGKAPLKPVQEMKNVGKSPRRDDIPAKVDGTQRWAVDMKVPGMLHARNVRPPVVGATLVASTNRR